LVYSDIIRKNIQSTLQATKVKAASM
jgi:hypothetical protein